MKILTTILLALTLIASAFGETNLKAEKTVVANIQTVIEQQIVYEAPLGSFVKKGERVFEVDPTIAHATVLSDAAAIKYNLRIYKDARRLVKGHSISKEQFILDKYNLIKAIEQYKIDKDKELHCTDYAPFDGIVKSINVYPGSGVGDGSTVMTIEKEYKNKITLGKLAKVGKMSVSTMRKQFKRSTKFSPIDYLLRLRLEKAAFLLISTTLPITEVAYKSGFTDCSYFAKQFKKITKLTPTTVRKKHEFNLSLLTPSSNISLQMNTNY